MGHTQAAHIVRYACHAAQDTVGHIVLPEQSLHQHVPCGRLATAKEYPVDSKVFFWSIGSNPWGRYLRISENGAGWGHRSPTPPSCAPPNGTPAGTPVLAWELLACVAP